MLIVGLSAAILAACGVIILLCLCNRSQAGQICELTEENRILANMASELKTVSSQQKLLLDSYTRGWSRSAAPDVAPDDRKVLAFPTTPIPAGGYRPQPRGLLELLRTRPVLHPVRCKM